MTKGQIDINWKKFKSEIAKRSREKGNKRSTSNIYALFPSKEMCETFCPYDRKEENLVWGYKDNWREWKQEYDFLRKSDIDNLNNLFRFATFFTQTMDKIASLKENEQIPFTLFEIRDLISMKLPANKEQFEFL